MQVSPLAAELFAPLPLRARGVLEILDTAIKLYRRYFWPLLAWSALVIVGSFVLSILPGGSMIAWLLSPLIVGATVCCIAAAVRGQPVAFKQCWQFTKPRYGPMLGMSILSFIIVGTVMLVLVLLGAVVVGLGFAALSSAPSQAQIVMGVIGAVVGVILFTVLFTVAMIWPSMVPIVVCMEDDKHNTQALMRAYELMRGHWVRVSMLMAVLMLGVLALTGILAATGVFIIGVSTVRDIANGQPPDNMVWSVIIGLGVVWAAMYVLWTPMYYVTLTLFYLDIRIRKEALDLEWTAHATAPPTVAPSMESPYMPSDATFPTSFAPPATTPVTTTPVTTTPATMPPANMAPATTAPAATVLLPQDSLPQDSLPQETPAEQPPIAAYITCPQCGESAAVTHNFCMKCGALLKTGQ